MKSNSQEEKAQPEGDLGRCHSTPLTRFPQRLSKRQRLYDAWAAFPPIRCRFPSISCRSYIASETSLSNEPADVQLLQWDCDTQMGTGHSSSSMEGVALFAEQRCVVLKKAVYQRNTEPNESTLPSGDDSSPPILSVSGERCGGEASDREEGGGEMAKCGITPLYGGKWRLLARSSALSGNVKQLGGSSGRCDRVKALTSGSITQLGLRDGAMDVISEWLTDDHFSGRRSLTCMDAWGGHGSVVGCSTGQVALIDWRVDPKQSENTFQCVVPHLGMISSRRGGRACTLPPPGVIACCTLENNYRLVCSTADNSIVVFDLRWMQSSPPTGGKNAHEKKCMSSFCTAINETPFGNRVSDIRHCQDVFGSIGMVDEDGKDKVTTVSQLEGGENLIGFDGDAIFGKQRQARSEVRSRMQVSLFSPSPFLYMTEFFLDPSLHFRNPIEENFLDIAQHFNGFDGFWASLENHSIDFSIAVHRRRHPCRCALFQTNQRQMVLGSTGEKVTSPLTSIGKTSVYDSFGGSNGSCTRLRYSRHIYQENPSVNSDPEVPEERQLSRQRQENFNIVSSLDSTLCFHSTSGNSVIVEVPF